MVPTIRCVLLVLFVALCGACWRGGGKPVASPEQSGELVVLVRSMPAEGIEPDPASLIPLEIDLARAFAQSQKLKIRFVRAADFDELSDRLSNHEAHFAIGVITPEWAGTNRFSAPIRTLQYVLVEHDGRKADPGKPGPDSRTLGVLPFSPGAKVAETLKHDRPEFAVQLSRAQDDMALIRSVAVRKLDVALTTDLQFDLATRYFPMLRVLDEIPKTTQLVWAFPPDADPELVATANAFIEKARNNGLIHRLMDRHVSPAHTLEGEDIATFLERMQRVLPQYREEFFAAERETGLDWRLIAAIAYQESHWDPLATSPTGVRGMMMLTEETADRLRVRDRLSAGESIRGGARYFVELRNMLPDGIFEPDRTWLALASYNIGPGHMNGVLEIARNMKRDIGNWLEVKKVLPLMSKPAFAARLKAGAARGGEAVTMAENVRTFYDILRHFQKPYASFIGPRERSLLAGNSTPPKLRATPAPRPAKPASPNEPPRVPTTLAPPDLSELAPEAAAILRERLGLTPPQAVSGTSASRPPM